MMKIPLNRIAPIEDVLLALVSTTAWLTILWIVDYAVDYWVGVVVIGYVAAWASRTVISNLTLFLLRRLRRNVLLVAKQLNIDIPSQSTGESTPGVQAVAYLVLLSVVATIVGSAVVLTTLITPVVGFPPLAVQFLFAGLVLLAIGLMVLVPFFALSFMLFASAKALSEVLSSRVSRIEQSEAAISRSRLLTGQRQAA